MRIHLRRLQHQLRTPSQQRIKHAWLLDTNFKFWDTVLRLSTPRKDDGPFLTKRPAPLSWRARI
eukprot:4886538-Pleurochrysis_carterae.AAC.1